LEAQEKRLETLGTVRRTFEISQMGVYNYDVLLDKTRDLTVEASFTLNGEEIENEDDLLVYVYLAENKSVVRYNRYDFDKFVLYPDADYKVFCVTGPGQLAFLPPESLNEIIDLMPVLRNIETPPVNFDMVKYKHNISTPADIMTFLNGAEQVAVVR
ncbi:MAG: hypothetical protein OEX02_21190, partial [Cyclobacteriaceae bacterium]|nr:hypothetical protein [Cyclobacteriaceae bacterium]